MRDGATSAPVALRVRIRNMRERIAAAIVAGLTLMVSVSLAGQSARSGTGWTVPRTPDGHPDMQGVWANNSMTPLERPL